MSKKKNRGRIVHGLVVLDKPMGMSSNHALQHVKRAFNAKKAGHTGTLDPLATGVLVICLGKATKVAEHIMQARKVYAVTAKLGVKTDTGDSEGEIIQTSEVTASQLEQLPQIIKSFLGEIEQVPPMYSALKHQGQPLYKLARKGEEVPRAARQVTIYSNQLDAIAGHDFTMRVSCSKGTYIRTLIEEIGEQLGCGAHVTQLRRLQVGDFGATFAMHSLAELEAIADVDIHALDLFKLPLKTAFMHYQPIELKYGVIDVLERRGSIKLGSENNSDSLGAYVRIYDTNGAFYGLAEVNKGELSRFQRIYSY